MEIRRTRNEENNLLSLTSTGRSAVYPGGLDFEVDFHHELKKAMSFQLGNMCRGDSCSQDGLCVSLT
ncbi:hypothetical protein P5673_030852 [Acropora cervicornis]|uniref:Uncharacterized protein n=1 Tax=Acropora cervicornis TaxID=6130 RepID=A0AAD9PTH8_ACRCE|nr:hypothetical protein P5673_030852 [Acropora cervicornis]